MKKFIFPLLLVVLIMGCKNNSNEIIKYNKFDDNSWNRLDIQSFKFDVKDSIPVDFYFLLKHNSDLKYSYINVVVTFYTPDGEMRSRQYHYRLKDTNLNWKGIKTGDIWTVELPIKKNMIFNKSGVCKIELENKITKMENTGVTQVGIMLKTGK